MLNSILANLRRRQDLMLVGVLFMTIVMMIVPVPTIIVDILIALNISLTVLILGVAVYLKRPDSFSTFPSIILFGTAFRLAISISTTRLILSEGDAGNIIETFGTFVTSGNVIVGLVVFLIITTVQFLVVTKGGERVAEVAARFVLDAMPGRQMSIDAEVRAGDITPAQAKEARRQLDRENKFYGAMDGAMKFIKGDAIAGLIITAVNLLGGMAVGMLQRGLSTSEAIDTYSRLTIGDGLVAQIPALLMALCAGTVITRIADENNEDLGSDIARQLTENSKTLLVAASSIAMIGLIPGFPTLVFLAISLALFGIIFVSRQRAKSEASMLQDTDLITEEDIDVQEGLAQPGDQVIINISGALSEVVDPRKFIEHRILAMRKFRRKYGFEPAPFGMRFEKSFQSGEYSVNLESVSLFQGSIPEGSVYAMVEKDVALLSNLEGSEAEETLPIQPGIWISEADTEKATESSVAFLSTEQFLVNVACKIIEENIDEMLGFEDAQAVLKDMHNDNPQLAEFVGQAMSPIKLLDILRRLAREGVSIESRRLLYRAIAEHAAAVEDPVALTEQIRLHLRRQICSSVADDNRVIAAYIFEPDLEYSLQESIRDTEVGQYLMMAPDLASVFLRQVESIPVPANENIAQPILVTTKDLRRHIRDFLAEHHINFRVLAYQEISSDYHLHPVGTLALSGKLQTEETTVE